MRTNKKSTALSRQQREFGRPRTSLPLLLQESKSNFRLSSKGCKKLEMRRRELKRPKKGVSI